MGAMIYADRISVGNFQFQVSYILHTTLLVDLCLTHVDALWLQCTCPAAPPEHGWLLRGCPAEDDQPTLDEGEGA